jgi:hypothetical protein
MVQVMELMLTEREAKEIHGHYVHSVKPASKHLSYGMAIYYIYY